MRPEIDAAADRLELRNHVEHAHARAEPGRLERQRERQAADAAADDNDVVACCIGHGSILAMSFDAKRAGNASGSQWRRVSASLQ